MLRVLACLAGAAIYALALPPFGWSMLAWTSLVPVLLAVRGRRPLPAFAYGLLFGTAGCMAVAWWLPQAAVRYLELSWPVALLALLVFAIVLTAPTVGLFGAGACSILRGRHPIVARIAVAALWTATELFRARVLAQPWGLLGYSQHAHPWLIQVAAVTGVYGVSFLLALGNVALADALVLIRAGRGLRAAVTTLALPAVLTGAVVMAGAFASTGGSDPVATQPVMVVQTNVPPAYRWTEAYAQRQLGAHLAASETGVLTSHPSLIVWPEHAITEYLESQPMLAAQLATFAHRHRTDLLFGAPRYADGHTYNSTRLITAAGRNGGHYDKRHLVLFAEQHPFQAADPGALDDNPESFTPGSSPGVLQGFVPLGVSICHEILYPELLRDDVLAGAALLVNVSNDGWVDGGHGTAAPQHLAMAIFRAVETHRYLARAATTGISAIIDPYGHVLAQLGTGSSGVVVAPVAGRTELTPYVRLGDTFAFGCALVAVAALRSRRRVARTARRALRADVALQRAA